MCPYLLVSMPSLQDFITRIQPSSGSRPRLQHVATIVAKNSDVSAINLAALPTTDEAYAHHQLFGKTVAESAVCFHDDPYGATESFTRLPECRHLLLDT